jgi:hypothetical protein
MTKPRNQVPIDQEMSDEAERRTLELLAARGFTDVQRLDLPTRKKKQPKRPDYLVRWESKPLVILEVKARLSGGKSTDGEQMSIVLNPRLAGRNGVQQFPVYFPHDQFEKSKAQLDELIRHRPELQGVAFVVVHFFDFFADNFELMEREQSRHAEISGFLRGGWLPERGSQPEAELLLNTSALVPVPLVFRRAFRLA